jgi:hypothetical protein
LQEIVERLLEHRLDEPNRSQRRRCRADRSVALLLRVSCYQPVGELVP